MPNFKKEGRGFKMKYSQGKSPFNFGEGTGGNSPLNENGDNGELTALKAQLLTARSPARKAFIRNKINEIIANQKTTVDKRQTASPGPGPRKAEGGYMTKNEGPGPSPGRYQVDDEQPRK